MIAFSQNLTESRFLAIETAIGEGTGSPYLHLYTGSRPPNLGAVTSENTLIASIELLKPIYKSRTGTSAVINTALESPVLGDGAPVWGRIVNGNNAPMIDLDIGEGLDVQLNTPILYAGGRVTVSSLILSE